jgi:hypothetical protein
MRTQRGQEDGLLKAFVLPRLVMVLRVSEIACAACPSRTRIRHNELWVTPKKNLSSQVPCFWFLFYFKTI